jgi:CTP synthase
MLLEQRGIKVTMLKMDPYLNVDPGTMSPFQHGEVFVLDDGTETDLDLGHYQRYVQNATFTRKNSFTAGRVYEAVIRREREGGYLGKTVQVIPHVTDQIKANIRAAMEDADLGIIEVGGTVGDIEGLPFLEAIRQIKHEEGAQNVLFAHLTLVPYIAAAKELKTKPTQHSVKELREIGIQPDILICRTDRALERDIKDKIGLFCNVPGDSVFSARDAESIYDVPLLLADEGLDDKVLEKLGIWTGRPDLSRRWSRRFTSPSTKSGSGLSVNTPTGPTPTNRSPNHWSMAEWPTTPASSRSTSTAKSSRTVTSPNLPP